MRKLAVTACFFSAAIFASQYLLPPFVQLWAGIGFIPIFVVFLFIKRFEAVRYIALGLAIGLIWNYIYVEYSQRSVHKLDGTTQTVTASVLAYPEDTEYGKSVLMRADGVKCRLYIYSEDYTELNAGDEINVRADFTSTEAKTDTDYYYSLGIPLFAYAKSRPEVNGKAPFSLLSIPAKAGKLLGDEIDKVCSYAAAFIKAIVTGDRNELKENTYIYSLMNVAGIIHCVSVSGMHVSFLVGLVYLLLGKRRRASLICIPMVFFFMAMTGFSAAVVRSGVMQLFICGASLTRREYDGRTALFLSLMLLLIINPYSAQNAGLQLSFGATLGILLFNERLSGDLYARLGRLTSVKFFGKGFRWLVTTLSVSLCALIFTVPITAAVFERVSIVAPLTNLVTLWAISLCFILGIISALAGFIWLPLGSVLAYPGLILVKYIYWILGLLGRIPFASVYTNSLYIRFWLIFIYAVLVLLFFIKGNGKGLAFTLVSISSFVIVLVFDLTEANADEFKFTALNVGQGQCIVITAKGYTAVIDCGGSSSWNAGDLAAEYLSSMGRAKIDSLILTHYHEDHAGGAVELMKRIRVEKLIAPDTGIDKTDLLQKNILSYAANHNTEFKAIYSDVYTFQNCGLTFEIVPPLGDSDENELCMCVLVSCGDFNGLVTGDVDSESELRLLDRVNLPDIEFMMAGHHGSKTSTSLDLLKAVRPEAVLISVGYNIYGHPSDELLSRLYDFNPAVDIYRTDEMGDLTVKYNSINRAGKEKQ